MSNKFNQDISEGILFTDQYQLMMAQLYFNLGLHETPAHFDHYFREYPDYGLHKAGYCINAGLEWFAEWMQKARFSENEIELLSSQKTGNGEPMFKKEFLSWLLENGSFEGINIKAVPEGRVIHPNTPVTVVQGPLAMSQILETALLNQVNFQILIATKASRIKEMARNRLMLEFGARRAQDRGR